MTNGHFKLVQLGDRSEALEEIRQLEQKLTNQIGSTISLIAYESEDDDK